MNYSTQNLHHSIPYCLLIIKPNLTHHRNMYWEGPEDSGARSSSIHTDLISFILQDMTVQSKEVSFPVSSSSLKPKQVSKSLTALAVGGLTHNLSFSTVNPNKFCLDSHAAGW